jgi:hypothetical protein
VRASDKNEKHSIKWAEYAKDRYRPSRINGRAFLPVLYQLMGWKEELKYTLTGFVKKQNKAVVIAFYTSDAEIRIYENGKMSMAYKPEWLESFGDKFLTEVARTQAMFDPEKEWNLSQKGQAADIQKYQVKSLEEYEEEMKELRAELEKGVQKLDD